MLNVKEPNDYGGRTFGIEISPSYTINIVEVEDEEKIVRLLDRGLIWTETEFEVTTDKNLKEALKFSFYKSKSHINEKDENEWERGRFKTQLNKALKIIKDYKKDNKESIELSNNKKDGGTKELEDYYREIEKDIGRKKAINFFQKYNIDLKKFYGNYNEINRSMESAFMKVKLDLEPTKSIEEFYKGPPPYPQWYIAAFPDVVVWAEEEIENRNKYIK